ncbi:hypothetical protein AOLI_G00182580 [Acnodon oligacanthus]
MAGERLCPLLSVHPCRCLVDEKFEVVCQHLLPALQRRGEGPTLLLLGNNNLLSEDASLGGSYSGVEPMGLLWSMRPVPGSKMCLRLRKKDVFKPTDVNISLYEGHLNEGFKDKHPLASVVAQRWYMAPGVQRVEVREKGLKGTLFIPPGPGTFPALLDLWAGGGGLVEYRSALLALRGYVSLSLQYIGLMGADGKPHNVGNDYFEAAFSVLKRHPQVCPNRVAIIGLSFGVFVTLGMAAYSSVIKPKCVICVSGSHAMPVNGSLADISDEIKKVNDATRSYRRTVVVLWGGQTVPHSRAQEDSWHKTLTFLEQHLYSNDTVASRSYV